MSEQPVLSVVVLSWNTRSLTMACLAALFAESPAHAREVIVVDNGSEDGSADAVAERYPQARLIRNPDNRLYAAGNNQGAAVASGEFKGRAGKILAIEGQKPYQVAVAKLASGEIKAIPLSALQAAPP